MFEVFKFIFILWKNLNQATKAWNESTLNRIVQLTEEAHSNKPKLQRWLDEFGENYSKVVVVLSLAIAFLGPFLFKWPFLSTTGRCRKQVLRFQHTYIPFIVQTMNNFLCYKTVKRDIFGFFSSYGQLVSLLSLLVNDTACRGSVYRALGLMVAASPCALAVAPLAYATAISSCAKKVSCMNSV